ncbi:MAG TPA: hypothetical protein VMP67_00920, partial [Candidatus Limnocylindria bacterium]|nr:hypothetical protein [Candidatus Limnocylindria bacterium]
VGKIRRPPRPEDPWSLLSGNADAVALVVPVLPLIASLPRSARSLSIREAEAVARVRRAAPDLPLAAALTLGALYVERERQRRPTADLDLYIAVGAWRYEGETVKEWRAKHLAYQRLADAADAPAISVDPLLPGHVFAGGQWLIVEGRRMPDGSTGDDQHERSTDEWNRLALDVAAERGRVSE